MKITQTDIDRPKEPRSLVRIAGRAGVLSSKGWPKTSDRLRGEIARRKEEQRWEK